MPEDGMIVLQYAACIIVCHIRYKYHCVDTETCKKGKAIPLQAWRGLEDSRRLRLPDFKTVAT